MSNKAFRIIPPEPGEIFLMDRGGNKPDRMVICKQAKMSFGKEKTEYRLVDLENGEMLEIKAKTLDEMEEYVHGLQQISELPEKFVLPEKILIGKRSFFLYMAEIYVSRAGITLQYCLDDKGIGLDYVERFPTTENDMKEFVAEKFYAFINSRPQTPPRKGVNGPMLLFRN